MMRINGPKGIGWSRFITFSPIKMSPKNAPKKQLRKIFCKTPSGPRKKPRAAQSLISPPPSPIWPLTLQKNQLTAIGNPNPMAPPKSQKTKGLVKIEMSKNKHARYKLIESGSI